MAARFVGIVLKMCVATHERENFEAQNAHICTLT